MRVGLRNSLACWLATIQVQSQARTRISPAEEEKRPKQQEYEANDNEFTYRKHENHIDELTDNAADIERPNRSRDQEP